MSSTEKNGKMTIKLDMFGTEADCIQTVMDIKKPFQHIINTERTAERSRQWNQTPSDILVPLAPQKNLLVIEDPGVKL